MKRALLAFALLVAAARAALAVDVRPIRDVRPTKLAEGDVLVVETPGMELSLHQPRVALEGDFWAEGAASPRPVRLVLTGQLVEGDRVLVPIDARIRERLGGAGRLLQTRIEVGTGIASAPIWRADEGLRPDLDFFPGSLRALATSVQSLGLPLPDWALNLVVMVLVALALHLLVAPVTGLVTVWERKVAGRMQSRFGPNRVGPRGWLQWLADALKLITKEDLVPGEADPTLFRFSPYLKWMSIFATFVVIPVSAGAIVADLDVGLLYVSAITAFAVIAILMGGWASNSKWSLLGGMRSAAQIVSYELPASLALLPVALLGGSLSPQTIVHAQGGLPHEWFVFRTPLLFVAFVVWFVSALAEGNRTPFDLPEAESELVSGYFTEYSGFRFSVFFLAEWTNLYVIGAVAATMFLGGWNVPFVAPELVAGSIPLRVLSIAILLAKVVSLVFVIIWIRWTLPRFRIDQMMALCWKYFLPFTFVAFLGTAAWMMLVARVPVVDAVARWSTFLVGGLGLGAYFVALVVRNFRAVRLLYVGENQFTWPWVEKPIDKAAP